MKKRILFLSIILILFILLGFLILKKGSNFNWGMIPGVKDFPNIPRSSMSSEEQGLLLAKYKPSQDKIMINGESFLILDTWTTYWFKTQFSKEINKNFYKFFVSIRNEETGKYCELKNENEYCKTCENEFIYIRNYVKYNGKKYGYTNGVGKTNDFLSIDFISENKPIPPDTITFEFKNIDKSTVVNFIKE
ncbi:MAG: hypothetical protein IPO21_21735 [Bacteroidales bacterium]|nr:hypothetical protein [Bacteroidales bacterium]